MCRLFALTGGTRRVRATFWLLDAPNSLVEQSRTEPDGVGVGSFDESGHPVVEKQPVAAYEDRAFAREARELCSSTFIAHLRYASTGSVAPENTHPFCMDGRLFAHNGVLGGLDRLDEHLGQDRALARGQTDSEKFFALITREARRNGGDVTAAITTAARWVAANLSVFALNILLATPEEVWALRYPDTHGLYLLNRAAGGRHGRHLEHSGTGGAMRVHSAHLLDHPVVVVASEPMDEDPGWQEFRSGQLVHVGPDLKPQRAVILPDAPAHRLTIEDLHGRAAKSQRAVDSAR